MTPKIQLMALSFSAGALALATIASARPEASPAPIQAAGNAAAGARLFLQCRACHTVNPGGAHTVGPNLAGVMGAKAATRPGYSYSPALRNARLIWNKPTMDAWLTRPSKLVNGNKMVFAGMANPQARADMMAYLGTLKAK